MKNYLLSGLLFFISVFTASATNPEISNLLTNLTRDISQAGNEDYVPEMVFEGNSIHVSWVTRVGNNESYLYYSRSTDLGETWESPKIIWQFKDGNKATSEYAQRLAVSGDNVYLGFAEYDYGNNGTGYIYFVRSINGGASFEEAIELENSGGGYSALSSCYIRASGNNVAIVYRDANYNNAFEGLFCLASNDNGASFTKSVITEENTSSISDLILDGNRLIVVHQYTYYYYGLNVGRVFVSVSNDLGATFSTNKVSTTFMDGENERERCTCAQDGRYVPKTAIDGNNIHVVFTGHNKEGVWSVLYARSTSNGQSFEEAVDINNGHISNIQNGHESVVAFNGHVYLDYLSTNSHVFLVGSSDSGASLSEPMDLMTPSTHFIEKTWWPQLAIDKTDETGKTVYYGGGAMMTRKSTDGGKTFSNTKFLAPILENGSDVNTSVMRLDENGGIHWLSKARWYWSYDFDIFYGKEKVQPEPGQENKALTIQTVRDKKRELIIVPSTESIEFDSVMTGEAWVKMRPGSGFTQNIFAKVNDYDGYFYNPTGYHLTFDNYNGKRRLEMGLKTDKGDYMNWTDTDVQDTLWHHVAFTYDANSGLNNFKSYLDGILIAEQTVTGNIIPGDGLLMIGSRSRFHYDANYLVDDIRLWNRALSQQELIENQIKQFDGNEEGLKLWLNFDDTFKDISGNENDAIPLYLGEFNDSDFDPPLTDFETFQTANTVTFSNKTKNGTNYFWNFGNDETSENGQPKHTFSTSGEYIVSLLGKNNTTVTSAIGKVSIVGLDRVEPNRAGNMGETILTIYGGGLTNDMSISLLSENSNEIVADTVVGNGEDGFIQALFPLTGEETGLYDLVVDEMVLDDAFTLEEAEGNVQPWVNVSGRGIVLLNRWTKYKITYGNNGDVDALMVPISFAVPDVEGVEVDFVDFKFELPDIVVENNDTEEFMPFKDYYITDVLWGKQQRSKVYSFLVPRIKAYSSESLHILIKSSEDYKITSWVSDPWVKYVSEESSSKSATIINADKAKLATAECITEAIGVTVIETSISVIPYAGALYNSAKTGYTAGDLYYEKDKVKAVRSTVLQGATTFFSYVSVVPVVGWVAGTVGGLVCGGISAYYAVSDCMNQGSNEKGVSAVSSLDPNEMVGPDGFGEKGWIQKHNEIPYTILFENKSEATAPAHDVFIHDTLDLSVFDISNFGFGSFGWGDTIFTLPGDNLKEFSMDIDLRPDLQLITRVSGKLDTINGVVNWEFLSLNPETMDLEEDPFIGFLPPNNTSPEGEGFVSFTIGLKEELGTNTEIRNKASIIFDANEPIITNEYLNTLDLDKPESYVNTLSETIDSHFPVSWTGSDNGSGIRGYKIYVLENDTLLRTWLLNTEETSAEFIGDVGSKYKFYSIAIDNVSHMEANPDGYDAMTHVTVDVEEFEMMKQELTVFPNPASDRMKITLKNAPCGVYVVELVDLKGAVNHSQIYTDFDIQNGIDIDVSSCQKGQYVAKIVFGNKSVTRKVLIY